MDSADPSDTDASELQGPWGAVDQRDLDAVEYWIEHKKGADFIVVDGSSLHQGRRIDPRRVRRARQVQRGHQLAAAEERDLPVWWAEWYVEPQRHAAGPRTRRVAVQAAAMMEFATSGATTALYWNPQRKPEGPASRAPAACGTRARAPSCRWRGILSGFTKWFPAGITLEKVTSSDPKVRVLAQEGQLVMVNTSNASVSTTVDGKAFTLKPYEIRWSDRGA